MDLLDTLVAKGLRRESPTREEALAILATSDDDLLEVVAAAGKVRRQWFGRRVKLNYRITAGCFPFVRCVRSRATHTPRPVRTPPIRTRQPIRTSVPQGGAQA